jgi:hypothetical protein
MLALAILVSPPVTTSAQPESASPAHVQPSVSHAKYCCTHLTLPDYTYFTDKIKGISLNRMIFPSVTGE